MKVLGVFVGFLLLFGTLSVGSVALGYGWAWFAAPWVGKLEARQEINSGASRIVNYEHFFNLCASVQTNEKQLDAFQAELKAVEAMPDARDRSREVARITANIAGVTAGRAGGINQYNADARKSYTQGQFRDASLPYQLATDTYVVGKGGTQCD